MSGQLGEWIHDDNNSAPAFGPALIVGCHGGAGATTLARLFADSAVEWWDPFAVQFPPLGPTIFVAHANLYGASKAGELLNCLTDLSERPSALVAVDDGRGPQPYQARLRFRALGGMVPVFRLPYVMRWRYVDDPLRRGVPLAVQRVIRRLHKAVFRSTVNVKG